jgi:hypothetical protein
MNKQFITNTIIQGSFFSVNKHLAKYLKSNDAALILSHLIYLQEHFFEGKEFYQQQERIMEECNVSLAVLRRCMNLLLEESIISISKKKKSNDSTPRNYYTINYSKVGEILGRCGSNSRSSEIMSTGEQDLDIRSSEIMSTGEQDSVAQRVYDNKINNNRIDKNKINKKEILINNKLYRIGNKIPSGFISEDAYVDFLYNREYGRVL